ncbi:MAG TPA: TolC family protein [Gemmataceae bacterium]|jgi:outer membrane protein TolC
MKPHPRSQSVAASVFALAGLLCLALCVFSVRAEPEENLPQPQAASQPQVMLTLNAAVKWALEHNPALATFRRNRGIAEAAVQIARQYPFNPIIQNFTWGGNGPSSAGVTNHVFNEHTARLDLELRRQGRYRRAMAQNALTRTEWEIAAQELLVAIQVTRAFNTLIYRQGKYRLLEEGAQLTEQVAHLTKQLVDQGTLRSSDLLLANADVMDARTVLGPGRSLAVVAENDLRRALGIIGESFQPEGTLEKGFAPPPPNILVQTGLERRPDLHALTFAVHEAEQRFKLEVANRWGNPSLGPAFEENETSVTFVGMWLLWQLPVINTRRGEIRQRQAELARAKQALTQGEIQMQQDVFTALARLAQAEEVVKTFNVENLPKLRQTREEFDKLYEAQQPGVALAQIIDIRRRLLRARDAYLDALFELSQAQTDLAAAVADLSFADCKAVPFAPEGEAPRTQAGPAGEELPPPIPVPDK